MVYQIDQQINHFELGFDKPFSLGNEDNLSHLERALEYRVELFSLINDLLNPHNSMASAKDLQNKLSQLDGVSDIKSLYRIKAEKHKIFDELIDGIFSNPQDYDFSFTKSPSVIDKVWTKALIIDDFVYYGPLTVLSVSSILENDFDLNNNPIYQLLKKNIHHKQITEIRVNKKNEIYYEAINKIFKWQIPFISEEQVETIIQRIITETNTINNATIKINASSPIADFEHPCGFIRCSAVLPPAAENTFLTLRIHPGRPYKLEDLKSFGMFDESIQELFYAIQKAGMTIAIAGTMGSGKTTLLSALAECWPDNGRKATIEDTPELRPQISDLIKMRTIEYDHNDQKNIDVTRLTKACKRHSVRYAVLSEARDGSAWEILQLSQAILGCLMTFHYTLRSPDHMVDQALNTLVALCKQHPLAPQGEDIKFLVSDMVQILILVEQSPSDNVRRIIKIYFITGFDSTNGGHFKYTELFSYDKETSFSKVTKSNDFENYLKTKGVDYKF